MAELPRINKILVIRGGAIGDFILTLPALAALRRQFPGSRLDILGHPPVASLALAGGLADGVQALDSSRLAGLFVAGGEWPAEVSAWFAEFDLTVSYLFDPGQVFQTNFARSSAARFISGPHRPDESGTLHAIETFLSPLTPLGITQTDSCPRLSVPRAPLPPRRWLAVHPGSGSPRKNWPEENWTKLLELIIVNTAFKLLVIGGEAEGDRPRRLTAALPPFRVRLATHRPLVELAGEMSGCAGFIGHDSGITHLAAALDLPGLVLWGESNETVWRPRSDKMKVLRSPAGLKELLVETVFDAFTPMVDPHHI